MWLRVSSPRCALMPRGCDPARPRRLRAWGRGGAGAHAARGRPATASCRARTPRLGLAPPHSGWQRGGPAAPFELQAGLARPRCGAAPGLRLHLLSRSCGQFRLSLPLPSPPVTRVLAGESRGCRDARRRLTGAAVETNDPDRRDAGCPRPLWSSIAGLAFRGQLPRRWRSPSYNICWAPFHRSEAGRARQAPYGEARDASGRAQLRRGRLATQGAGSPGAGRWVCPRPAAACHGV